MLARAIEHTPPVVAEERRRFPDWEPEQPEYDAVRRELRPEFAMLDNTDIAICPAESVRDDLVCNFGFPRERATVVPYGADPEWLEIRNNPIPARILFDGSACLRKGIHYLAMAADTLVRDGKSYEFRIAGDVTPRIANQPVCRNLTFLGRVPRYLIQQEFHRADLLVLPTLAEGSAEVVYQALAVGIPVVTTPEAGSVVRNGIDGLIVPCRSIDALAQAISKLVEDCERRDKFARAARLHAHDYTWDRYGQRLLAVLHAA